MKGDSVISAEVLARYAAAEVGEVEVHVVVDYGADIAQVAEEVHRRVADYLGRMAGMRPTAVNVVVDDVQR